MTNDSFIAAADLTNIQAGGSSIFEDAYNIATKGVTGAIVSGWHGLLNTGVDITNKVTGSNFERADTAETLDRLDSNYGDYYKQNKAAIDVAGFVAGSLVPGTLAVKGLKLLQAGETAGIFGRTLGYAAGKEKYYLNEALKDLEIAGGTVFQRINENKLASMAWGVADNVLQTAAFETAVAVSMKASPMLDKEDWSHIGWDVITTSILGGVAGGALQAIFTNKLVKDAGKLVEAKQREADILKDIGKTDLGVGDKAFSLSEAILSLPKEVFEPTVKLTHGRKGITDTLDLTGLLDKTVKESAQRGLLKLEQAFMDVVENDKTVGTAVTKAFFGIVKDGLEKGVAETSIRQELGTYLFNLRKVEAVGARSGADATEIVYLTPGATIKEASGNLNTAYKEGDLAFRVISSEIPKQGTLGKEFQTLSDAWDAGFDIMLNPTTQKLMINPASTVLEKIDAKEAGLSALFLNTVTKQTSSDAKLTIADIATVDKPLTINAGGVSSGRKTLAFSTSNFDIPKDSIEATARHIWMDDPKAVKQIFGQIDSQDVSVLDAILKRPDLVTDGLTILNRDEQTVTRFADIVNFETYVFKQKYTLAIKLLEREGTKVDLRDIAYRLNVTGEWLDNAVSTKFNVKEAFKEGGWKQDASRFANRENLILRYDKIGQDKAQAFPEGNVAYEQRVKEAQGRARDASATVFGADYAKLISVEGSLAGSANSQGIGASGFGASNANYFDKLASWGQYTGQVVSNLITKRSSAVLSELQTPLAKLVQNPQAAAELVAATTRGRLSTTAFGLYRDAREGAMMVDLASLKRIAAGGKIEFKERIPLREETAAVLETYQKQHAYRVDQQNVLAAAQGFPTKWDPNQLYFPPVDTQRVPFFAFVRQTDGSVFGSSEIAMITGRNAAELQKHAAAVESMPGMSVIYKSDSEAYFKAKREYDFSRTMNAPQIDSTIRKTGSLGDYLPNFTPQAIAEDFINFTQRAESKLVRDAVSVNYGQTFAELKDLSGRYTAAQESKFRGPLTKFVTNVVDPFDDAMKLALNVSKRGHFPIWNEANEFVDALGTRAYQFIEKARVQAGAGKISWEEANATLQKFGVGAPFDGEKVFNSVQHANDRNLIALAVQKANSILAAGMLRLDVANSLLNVVSTPILLSTEVSSIRNSLKNNPELFAKFNNLLSEEVPGTAVRVPSTVKLIANAVGDLTSVQGKELMARFKDIGTVKGPAALMHEMVDELSLTPKLLPSEWAKNVDNWVEKGSKLTGNNLAEDYTRFVTSHVMWQLTEPLVKGGRMTIQEQNAFISIFTNRVQGNYIASQRPIAFQGTIGAAIGLFQTYQFNMFQQLYRHIENRDLKTLAVAGAMQTSLFGLNSLPMFHAINTQVIGNASINEGHKDAYSYAVQAAGKKYGDFLMYGTASAFPAFSEQAPALWTRGDLNPRSAFILPTSPMETPALQAGLKVVQTLLGMGNQLSKGGDLGATLLFGLEHNGVNRPLAGLAQVLQGQSTTSKGNLISAAGDWNSISTFSRLIGAKPMDESIALTTMYSSKAYQAMDKEKIDLLGTVIKQKLRKNETLSEDDWVKFQGEYAASGGRIQGFTQAMRRWDKASNTSIVNEVMRHNQRPSGQRMIEMLGGDALRDYRLNVGTDEE